MKYLFLTLFYSLNVLSFDGVIRVLEAPLFSTPSKDGKIIQYKRKGSKVYIHNSEDSLVPISNNQKYYIPQSDHLFYKTLTDSRKEAYILKDHVFIHYHDKRELSQNKPLFDDTDYRIEEPLKEGYPFIQESGYRGQFIFGLGTSNFSAYPYRESIANTSFSYSKNISAVWSTAMSKDLTDRFYLGAYGGLSMQSGKFSTENQLGIQELFRFSIGPYISYDNYQTDKLVVSFFTTLQVNILDEVEVKLSSSDGNSESRSYNTWFSLSPLIGFNFQFPKAVGIFDIYLGTSMKLHLPKKYQTSSTAKNDQYWRSTQAGDSYSQPLLAESHLYFGLQSFY